MSPEQSGILKRNIDTRSDLYSLGILFYQLMTGQLPYKASEVGELIHQHIAMVPVEPADLVPGMSFIINKIILKLIRKDPDDRYQTAYGLAEDLELYLSLNEEQKKTYYLELGKKDRLKGLNYRTQLIGRTLGGQADAGPPEQHYSGAWGGLSVAGQVWNWQKPDDR